jgi:hypothetical protein
MHICCSFLPKRGTAHDSIVISRSRAITRTNAQRPLASLSIHRRRTICTLYMHTHPASLTSHPQQQLTVLTHSPEHKSYTLLASCMHAGSRIVRLGRSADVSSEWEFSVLAKFEEHKSMNYGSDVQPVQRGQEGGRRTIVSTSFYDKLMCVWQFG